MIAQTTVTQALNHGFGLALGGKRERQGYAWEAPGGHVT
jgi:hypothetical protein